LHTGRNKPFEQEMNFLIQICVLNGDADLMAERNKILEVILAERLAVFVINGLQYAQQMAVSRYGHTDHVARNESAGLIHMAEEMGVVLDVINDDGLSGSGDMPRNSLSAPEPGSSNRFALHAVGHIEIQFAGRFIQQEERAGFGVHQKSGRFDGTLADRRMVEA